MDCSCSRGGIALFCEHHAVARAVFDKTYGVRTDGQAHLGAINIDDMPASDRQVAAEHPALHADVRRYAVLRRDAEFYRLTGNIALAARTEMRMEDLYEQMPAACRW